MQSDVIAAATPGGFATVQEEFLSSHDGLFRMNLADGMPGRFSPAWQRRNG
jgi:hypothetical protein